MTLQRMTWTLKGHTCLYNHVCVCHNFIETVANVDEVLGEMFLEEVQPTEEQLIVSTCTLFIDTVNDCTMYGSTQKCGYTSAKT